VNSKYHTARPIFDQNGSSEGPCPASPRRAVRRAEWIDSNRALALYADWRASLWTAPSTLR